MRFAILSLLILALLFQSSFASTSCNTTGCTITITINIAVSGANQSYIDRMKNEIETVWNGQGRTTGDCKCPVTFTVNAVPISALNQTNCTPPAPGYHCVEVTPWNGSTESLPSYTWPNGTTSYYVGYMGRTQPSPPQNGASTDGWWSDQMSRPVGGGSNDTYKDFAHEAGHMMGLADWTGGLMNFTSGPNATPTQSSIDQAVENACGKDACPDRCCCGNGQIEGDKGEVCDPKATPNGCVAGASCCPVCCSCYRPACDPSKGEYPTMESCAASCPQGSSCYQNYRTGCWDCVKQIVVVTPSCYEKSTAIMGGCGHEILHEMQRAADFYNSGLAGMPFFSAFFANERINVYLGNERFGAVVEGGTVSGTSAGLLAEPTMNLFIMPGALEEVEGGLSVPEAMEQGKIRLEGVGWLNSIRVEIAKFLANAFAAQNKGTFAVSGKSDA